jgi:hypothetical protein
MKTIEQFLEALRQTPRDWYLYERDILPGALRRGYRCCWCF